MTYCCWLKTTYIDIEHKSIPMMLKPTSDAKISKIRRLLLSKLSHFELSPWSKHKEDAFALLERSSIAPKSPPC